jgi:3-dehydroquinate dehydratase-1
VSLQKPNVVGAVHTLGGLRLAQKLRENAVDIIEIRVDALLDHLPELERALPRIDFPLLITVRHPAEGGLGNLPARRRRELIERFLPQASLVDIELRSVPRFRTLIEVAKSKGVKFVLSDHHFQRTPSLGQMKQRLRRAFHAGADVFKLAAVLPGPREFARLLDFTDSRSQVPRALMGMGKFGQVSRLALAQAGSVLNYGYLDCANAPGQWEARALKQLLGEIGSL